MSEDAPMTITYSTPADFLAVGLKLGPLPAPPIAVPVGTHCALTGQPLTCGYPVSTMVTPATAEFLDHFRGGIDGYVSDAAARCYKSANPRSGNPCARSVVTFADNSCWNPLIASVSAHEQGRPCWSEFVRELWPSRAGQMCLIILTTDTKKRLWPSARIGALGPRTPVYYYDSKTAGNGTIMVDWPRMVECLELIESIYRLGFPKTAMGESLYSASKIAQAVGLREVRDYESQLTLWRGTAEMKMGLLIAQKGEEK